MSDTGWPDRLRGAFRVELRAEAIGLAGRGWPVLPGTRVPEQQDSGEWTRPVPVESDWQNRGSANPDTVAAFWADAPYSLLVATGTLVDGIEVGDGLGRRAARLLRVVGRPAPIVAMPDGRWIFLTRTSNRIPGELADHEDVQWHGSGSWIPLPPTPLGHGVVHWRVKPEVWGWRLPSPEVVHDVLLGAVENEPSDSVGRLTVAGTPAA